MTHKLLRQQGELKDDFARFLLCSRLLDRINGGYNTV